MTIKVICINKDNGNHDNPHEAITHYGWFEVDSPDNNGRATRAGMVAFLETRGNSAYVSDGQSKAYCYVRQNRFGTKFIQTHKDNKLTDNLLKLPECKIDK